MRILTTRKLYRAFRSLDRFDDEQCRRLLRSVRDQLGYGVSKLVLVGFVGVVTLMIAVGIAGAYNRELELALYGHFGRRVGDVLAIAIELVFILASPAIFGLLARDMLLGVRVHAALRRRIKSLECPGCRYLLLGQRSRGITVTCPECGMMVTLEQLGLRSADDLIPRDPLGAESLAPPDRP